ncbi:LppU/SCO3897 family protein [Streptomyces sp. JWR5-1]|uniref:LppU/SCO3897 family protein n=1 Tax=Streptomyces sp. JWR5-1 TaxID=3122053 RepID=UPI0030190830
MTTPQQPGTPEGQQPPATPPHPHAQPVPPQPKKSPLKKIAGIVVPVIALGTLGYNLLLGGDDTTKLEVGDCLRNTGSESSPDVEKLDCGDPEAKFKVLDKKEDTVATGFSCSDVEGATTILSLQESKGSATSRVLCLGDN